MSFGIDDVLIIPALVCVIGMMVTMFVGAALGEMAQQQTNVIRPEGPVFTDNLRVYEKCNYVLRLLPLISLGFSKVSVLCFYRRIFRATAFRIVNSVLLVIVICWAVSFFFATVFQCERPSVIWNTFEYTRTLYTRCVETLSCYYAVSISGFITDIMILVSPIPMVWRLQMSLKNKIAVACTLLLGCVVCGAGIARFTTFIKIGEGIAANINDLTYFTANINDLTYFTAPVFAWTMIESSLAVVSANLPLLRPLLWKKTYTESGVWSLLSTFRNSNTSRRRFNATNGESNITRGRMQSQDGHSKYKASVEAIDVSVAPPIPAHDQRIHIRREYEVV